jgi:hypothetical protein
MSLSVGLSSECVACGVEVVLALLRAKEIADLTDGGGRNRFGPQNGVLSLAAPIDQRLRTEFLTAVAAELEANGQAGARGSTALFRPAADFAQRDRACASRPRRLRAKAGASEVAHGRRRADKALVTIALSTLQLIVTHVQPPSPQANAGHRHRAGAWRTETPEAASPASDKPTKAN